jgi:hypothetical protein
VRSCRQPLPRSEGDDRSGIDRCNAFASVQPPTNGFSAQHRHVPDATCSRTHQARFASSCSERNQRAAAETIWVMTCVHVLRARSAPIQTRRSHGLAQITCSVCLRHQAGHWPAAIRMLPSSMRQVIDLRRQICHPARRYGVSSETVFVKAGVQDQPVRPMFGAFWRFNRADMTMVCSHVTHFAAFSTFAGQTTPGPSAMTRVCG